MKISKSIRVFGTALVKNDVAGRATFAYVGVFVLTESERRL